VQKGKEKKKVKKKKKVQVSNPKNMVMESTLLNNKFEREGEREKESILAFCCFLFVRNMYCIYINKY